MKNCIAAIAYFCSIACLWVFDPLFMFVPEISSLDTARFSLKSNTKVLPNFFFAVLEALEIQTHALCQRNYIKSLMIYFLKRLQSISRHIYLRSHATRTNCKSCSKEKPRSLDTTQPCLE